MKLVQLPPLSQEFLSKVAKESETFLKYLMQSQNGYHDDIVKSFHNTIISVIHGASNKVAAIKDIRQLFTENPSVFFTAIPDVKYTIDYNTITYNYSHRLSLAWAKKFVESIKDFN